jgi:hypothetical protein
VLREHVQEMVPQDMLCVDGKVLLGELREAKPSPSKHKRSKFKRLTNNNSIVRMNYVNLLLI